jgi:ubiquinone/menaquinone biosynthesis C-methylase UbiE
MGLVDLPDVAPFLVCPRCKSGLVESDRSFWCSSPSCDLHAADSFPLVGRWPALVDFERSILVRRNLLSSSWSATSSGPLTGSRKWSIDRLPAWLRSLWTPANRVAKHNVERLRSLLSGSSPLVLVVGGGTIGNGVEALYADPQLRLIAFDVYGSSVTQFIADAHQIPLADASMDAVVVQAVLEHVLDPGRVVDEIRRVLRDDGIVYAETPFLQQVHAGPYDFNRFTSSGHRYLFRSYDEIAAGPVAGPGTQLLWSVDHVVRGLMRSELLGKLARALFFWLRFLDRLIPTAFAMDDATAYYFLGRRTAHELTPREIVDYYQGAQQRRDAVERP